MRLLSPEKRRLYPNARTGTGLSPAADSKKNINSLLREGLKPGVADDTTWLSLKNSGWTEYDGPAATDERGYVVVGSDPNVVPNPWPTSSQGRPTK